jgi:hypothetical protein
MAPLADELLSAQINKRDLEKIACLKLNSSISHDLRTFTTNFSGINMLKFVHTTAFTYNVNGINVWFELNLHTTGIEKFSWE